MSTRWALMTLGFIALSCSAPPVVPDAGPGPGVDAGVDAGTPDAGPYDAGFDAGLPDAGDAGPRPDAGSSDAGLPDAGPADAGRTTVVLTQQIFDFCNGLAPLANVQVTTLSGGAGALTDTGGYFRLRVPPDVPFTAVLQLSGYATSYFPELSLSQDLLSPINSALFCASAIQTLSQTLTNYNAQQGIVFGWVYTSASTGPCTDQSGWTFQLTPSTGEIVAYIDINGNIDPMLTATSTRGYALIYNVGASRVNIKALKPDAGCTDVSGNVGMTGFVQTAPGVISYGGVFVE